MSDKCVRAGTVDQVRTLGSGRFPVHRVPLGQRAAGGRQRRARRRRLVVARGGRGGRGRGAPAPGRVRVHEVHGRGARPSAATVPRRPGGCARCSPVVALVSAVEPGDGRAELALDQRAFGGRVQARRAGPFLRRPPPDVRRAPQVHAQPSSSGRVVSRWHARGARAGSARRQRPRPQE